MTSDARRRGDPRTRATLTGAFGLVLVALVVFGRFPAFGEVYLPVDLLGPRPHRNELNADPLYAVYPRILRMGDSLRAGRGAPRWEPDLGLGEPAALAHPGAPDYPAWRIVHGILPAWAAQTLTVALHLAHALVGTFLLLRVRGASLAGGLAGACVYGLSGLLSVWLETVSWTMTASWLPWGALGLELLSRSPRAGVALVALGVGGLILGGSPQTALLGTAFLGVHALLLVRGASGSPGVRAHVRRLALAAAGVSLGLGLAAVRLAPAVVELRESSRAAPVPFEQWIAGASLRPERLLLLVAPDAFGDPVSGAPFVRAPGEGIYANPQELRLSPGVVALALALAAALDRRSRRPALVAAGVLLLALPTPLARLTWPLLGNSGATRILGLLPLAVALLVPDGWRRVAAGEVRLSRVLAPIVLVLLVHAAGLWPGAAGGEARAVLKPLGLSLGAGALALHAERRGAWSRGARAALLALVVLDLSEATIRWNASGRPERLVLRNETADRIRTLQGNGRTLALVDGVSPPLLLLMGLRSIGSYAGALPGRPADLLAEVARRSGWRRGRQYEPATGLRAAWRDALSVRVILRGNEGPTDADLTGLVPDGTPLRLVNPAACARARVFSGRAAFLRPDRAAALALAIDGARFDPRERVVLELPGEPREPASDAPAPRDAAIVVDEPERVVVRARAVEPSWLVLADAFASGWSATCDGEPTPIVPTDVALRAVALPPGDHEVSFSYTPPGWPTACAVSLATAAVLLGLLATLLPRGRRGT